MPLTVYFAKGHNTCRACGLTWHAVQLEPCPRCNEGSLHAQGVELLEERDQAVARIKELEQGIEELYVERDDWKDMTNQRGERIAELWRERDEARTIARQLVALVRKLRGDLDGTKGELRRAEVKLKIGRLPQ